MNPKLFTILFFAALGSAQTAIGLLPEGTDITLNQREAGATRAVRATGSQHAQPRVVVFTGDTVVPQFVDGAGWQTSITVINLENHATSFDVGAALLDSAILWV